MNTATTVEAYGVANMTADKRLQFQICVSDAEREATTRSLADTRRVTKHLAREISGITLNEQTWFKMEFFIRMIEFEAWWETICIQALRKTIEQSVICVSNGSR